MSLKRYCLVPPTWDVRIADAHTCDDRSHVHLSRAQVFDLETDDLVEWLRRPVMRRDKGVLRLRRLVPTRGLSARVGVTLADGVRRRLAWARLMLSDVQMTPSSRMPA